MIDPKILNPKVFRSYDIRALVPDLVDEKSIYYGKVYDPDSYQSPLEPAGVEIIGRGLAEFLKKEGTVETIIIGRDTRLSSPAWADALAEGIMAQGVHVLDIGLASSDTVYFASGKYNLPAVMITASHCTKELNGIKMVRAGANVIGQGAGMEELRDLTVAGEFPTVPAKGNRTTKDVLPEYVDFLMQYVDAPSLKSFKIIGDAGNGVGGVVCEALVERIPSVSLTPMYFAPDGRFPNHDANPFEVENIHELIARVPKEGADLGVAWDGDADRVFFLDENGHPVPGDFITALVATYFLKKFPGSAIVYDIRASWAVRDTVTKAGGHAIAERVGHSYIKRTMRRENAVFGGEVSGHYYFRENYYADNGYLPLVAVLHMLSEGDIKMSELVKSLGDYHISGEINSTVPDTQAVIHRIAETYKDADINYLDGITVNYPDWHFNVRPSANDPVVRLNLEAKSQAEMEQKRDAVLALIRG